MTDQTGVEDDDEGVLEESGEELLESYEEAEGSANKSAAEPLRVEQEIHGLVPVWRGVRDCNQKENAMSAFKPVWNKWVAQTIAKHPDRVAVAKGFYDFRYRWENKTEWNGKRKCKGVCTRVMAYVDFA